MMPSLSAAEGAAFVAAVAAFVAEWRAEGFVAEW
jgi:hypothetical protein